MVDTQSTYMVDTQSTNYLLSVDTLYVLNFDPQIGEFFRTPSLDRNLLVLVKKSVAMVDMTGVEDSVSN